MRFIILLLGIFVLTSCGGGAADLPNILPGGGEGTSASPVDLGIVGQPAAHAGSVEAFSNSYYKFRTDASGGKYRLSLTNTNSSLKLALYPNANWSGQILSCDNIWTAGDIVCVTPYSDLTPNTDYYIEVSEWDFTADTYTLGISRVESEGTATTPILLTAGIAHTGSIDAVGASYYKFQTSSSGEYKVSIAGLSGMGSNLLGIQVFVSDFTSPNLVKSCSAVYDPVCTVNGLAQNTFYFVKVTQNATNDALYNIRVDKGSSEGSLAAPFPLPYGGADHAGAADGSGFSYYTFTPTNSGDSIITLSTTSTLQVSVYSDTAFSAGQTQLCNFIAGGVCTVSNVNQGVPYYLLVTNYAASSATFTVNVKAGSNEGTLSQPIDISLDQPHSGTIDGHGTSYYTFTTTKSGSYTITLNTALLSTYWSLYKDQNFTQNIYSISHPNNSGTLVTDKCSTACATYYYQDGGKTYYNLDSNTTYYLTVRNDSAVSGTFTLAEATGTGNSEGSINDPVVLTEGTPWSGRVGADINSFYTFTPSLSTNYLIRLTNLQDTTGDWGMTMDLYSDAGFVTTLGYCSSRSYYTTLAGDVVCAVNSFTSPALASLTAGTPYYVKLHNNEFYTANTYSISVSPYDPSLGCNGGGATCYTFELPTGIPPVIDPNPATPLASDSSWALNSLSFATGAQSFKSSKPNGNVSTYRSCFKFSGSNVKWIGYSAKIVTTGTDALNLYVYDSVGAWAAQPTLVSGSTNTAWQRKVYIPPVNAYVYEWCYEKSSAATSDAAWIDDIELN